MKNIELTEEHKSKLLQMCFKLFKKEMHGLTIQDNGFLNYSDTSKTVDYDDRIHWFEFCMTYLVNALAWETITTDILADCEYEDSRLKYLLELAKDRPSPGQYHPIDYLYEEFKKL